MAVDVIRMHRPPFRNKSTRQGCEREQRGRLSPSLGHFFVEGTFSALWVSAGRCEFHGLGCVGWAAREGTAGEGRGTERGECEKQVRGQGSSRQIPAPTLLAYHHFASRWLWVACQPPLPSPPGRGARWSESFGERVRLGVHRVGGGEQSRPPVLAELALAPRGP